jgi:Peptidase S24-like
MVPLLIGNLTEDVNGYLTVSRETAKQSNYRRMDNLKTIVGRIERRLAAIGSNPTAASRQAGLSPSAIYNLQRGARGKIPVKGGHSKTYDAIAPVLKTSVAWLTKGEGPEEVDPDQRPPRAIGRERVNSRVVRVPLLDLVTAGKLKGPLSQIPMSDVPLLTFADLGRGEFFALRVEQDADSMDRLSPPGSILVVNKSDRELRNGRCYIFEIDGEMTYKMWNEEPRYLAPYSTNPIHKPIIPKRMRDLGVIGRVKRTVLDL